MGNTVKEALPNMPMKRSNVVSAMVVHIPRAMNEIMEWFSYLTATQSVIMNQEENPRGTQFFGPIVRELREYDSTIIVSTFTSSKWF